MCALIVKPRRILLQKECMQLNQAPLVLPKTGCHATFKFREFHQCEVCVKICCHWRIGFCF